MNYTVLIVDDEEGIRSSLKGILEDEGYSVSLAVNGNEALTLLQSEIPDLILLDIWMPGMDGLETLANIRELYPEMPVVMISGHGTIETAVRSTKLGAFDFIEKPLSLDKVLVTVHNAIDMSRLRRENESLRGIIEERFEIVGNSEAASLLRDQVRIVAPTNASILICGENGTSKESVAHAIHRASQRSNCPLITVNCAAIPEELIESEIFGHEKGAFQGAVSQRKGRLDYVEGGTLFLEEIAEMPLHVQLKLQRLIAEQKFERAGGGKSFSVNVRVICSTSVQLEDAVKAGVFSEDLYYLINVVPFDLPPLRERIEDIPALVDHFLDLFCRREMREKKTMSPKALAAMQEYSWPGNNRELKNIMERLVIMSHGNVIDVDQLPDAIHEQQHGGSGHESIHEAHSLREAREGFEREFLIQKLDEHDWNITRTAEAIELERSNLHRKIKSYGIDMKK